MYSAIPPTSIEHVYPFQDSSFHRDNLPSPSQTDTAEGSPLLSPASSLAAFNQGSTLNPLRTGSITLCCSPRIASPSASTAAAANRVSHRRDPASHEGEPAPPRERNPPRARPVKSRGRGKPPGQQERGRRGKRNSRGSRSNGLGRGWVRDDGKL